jgi:hypothetical protein
MKKMKKIFLTEKNEWCVTFTSGAGECHNILENKRLAMEFFNTIEQEADPVVSYATVCEFVQMFKSSFSVYEENGLYTAASEAFGVFRANSYAQLLDLLWNRQCSKESRFLQRIGSPFAVFD